MKKKALFLLSPKACEEIYGPEQRAQIAELADLIAPPPTEQVPMPDADALRAVELVFGGWGSPVLDAAFLGKVPSLKAFFYGAGSIRGITPEAFWDRNIPITSSYAANGVPVAEFTEALVILSLKRAWQQALSTRTGHRFARLPVQGAYRATVGLISLGMIGQLVARRLQSHDLRVIAYDPFVTQEKADALGLHVRMASLPEVFATADVVSLHAPNIPETRGMVSRELLRSLKPNATFLNTARGAILDEKALTDLLADRPDVFAALDVTFPEPPPPDSPLYSLPNVFLTPHIAGSLGNECHRMGQLAVDECRRFLAGEPLAWRITREMSVHMA